MRYSTQKKAYKVRKYLNQHKITFLVLGLFLLVAIASID